MSWLRNSPLRASFIPKRVSPPKECDPGACTESFKKHWQQVFEILQRTQPPAGYPMQDDVLAVVNHLSQMVTLLHIEYESKCGEDNIVTPTPCLEYLLSENILERLFNWSIHTGKFNNAVKSDQFTLYELLVSQERQKVLVHEPFLRPLLKILTSCCGEVFTLDLERRLVKLVYQLCNAVIRNIELLELFFDSSGGRGEAPRFILFSLLIPFIHRDGAIGQEARAALLLCMTMSDKNDFVGAYITEHSDVCPVLATGLSGLYSLLPRKLEIEVEDWYRLTSDDVNEVPELTLFMNSLEFCNAVAKMAHTTVRDQLLEFIYQGFLVPVMGPALLQDSIGTGYFRPSRAKTNYHLEASTLDELVAATAYYELFLRHATDPGLMQTLTKFLLCDCFDGQRILNTLITRINSPSRLSLVTLSLMETLISLDSEDVMYELVFKHLQPCTHVMLSQRRRLREVDPYAPSALRFLSLTPSICQQKLQQQQQFTTAQQQQQTQHSNKNVAYGVRPDQPLYGNYHAYLCDARYKIDMCAKNCCNWRLSYDSAAGGDTSAIFNTNCDKDMVSGGGGAVSLVSLESSGYESFALGRGGSAESTPENEPMENNLDNVKQDANTLSKSSNFLQVFNSPPEIGPFLDALLKALEKMPNNSLYVNLRLTGVISRLAVYPHLLLASFLLNHSLVFQPSIRSLFQVLGSLKQKLDTACGKIPNVDVLVSDVRQYLLEREEKLAMSRTDAIHAPTPVNRKLSPDTLNNNNNKDDSRISLTSMFNSVVRRVKMSSSSLTYQSNDEIIETDLSNTTGVRFSRRSQSSIDKEEEDRKIILCALVLDEWLKELAAIAQEHTLFSLSC